ncbi:hypothetical protein [Sphingomicrobium aestuariivivum]|uniref:hypothetical protein n=1 Tax=Sphingomicrobium aestuariivivum TaxID=1582356 RepID=UPI001FD675BF|nr:hypothetical protein [Sphingomicrobium aestuariivivum]MCJ8191118.1 hypothetical protein [Sphingomicrobium aestuariivivum]
MSWKKRVGLGAALVGVGMVAALYGVSQWETGQQWLGLEARDAPATAPQALAAMPVDPAPDTTDAAPPSADPAPVQDDLEAQAVENRIAALEQAMLRAEGAAGRADGLLLAFAARRAIERGLPLGYLEPLLVDRFGRDHEAAVGTVIAGARTPVPIETLVADYGGLGTVLRGPGPDAGLGTRLKRTLASLVMVYPASEPNPRPRARYERALVDLKLGNVETALAETMRLPGAGDPAAQAWIAKARRYVAIQRALDSVESAALLSREQITTN